MIDSCRTVHCGNYYHNVKYSLLSQLIASIINKKENEKKSKHKNSVFKCLLRLGVLRVFVLFCMLVFVRAILTYM